MPGSTTQARPRSETTLKLLDALERPFYAAVHPLVDWLIRSGIKPNTITTLGTGLVLLSALAYGLGAIRVAGLLLLLSGVLDLFRGAGAGSAYRTIRAVFARSILLGLEFLVAADIIRTVAVQPSLENVAVLGLIIFIRTFLSFSLEVELDGRWPWARASSGPTSGGS